MKRETTIEQQRQSLPEPEAVLAELLDSSNESIVVSALDTGEILSVSRAFCRLSGYDRSELIGHTAADLGLQPSDEARQRAAEAFAATGSAHGVLDNLRVRNGDVRQVEFSSDVLRQGDRAYIVTVIRDVTEQRGAENQLRESEARFRSVFENSLEGILLVTPPAGEILQANPAACEMLGRSEDELRRIGRAGIVDPTDYRLEPLLRERELTGRARGELRFTRGDGTPFPVEVTSSTFEDADGSLKATWVFRDITERMRADAVVREARAEAERANHGKSEFLSRMSHELRTPLNAILGFAQLLELDNLPGNSAESVRHILKGGRHLLQLINEVLDIERLETGSLTISPEPVDVSVLGREAVDLMSPLAASKGVDILFAVPDDGTHVVADRQRLLQVLLNLLSNAIKYAPIGTAVRVEVENTAEHGVRLSVSDEGRGISPEQQARLFQPFERLGEAAVEGTGLGLALSKRLVEIMGGTIGVTSALGKGSTFWVELQTIASPTEASAVAVPAEETAEHVRGRKMLYVEDNLSNIALVERLLERIPDTTLLTAMQGSLALTLAREHGPDVILLDLHLPDMNGTEVLRQLKADRKTRAIPVVVITADATPGLLQRLTGAGASAYLTKPIDVPAFYEVMGRLAPEAAG